MMLCPCLQLWLIAGEASTSFACSFAVMSGERSSSRESHATSTLASEGPLEETSARGSREWPRRAFHPLAFPRDGREPCVEATGSDEFPPRCNETACYGTLATSSGRGYALACPSNRAYELGLPPHHWTRFPAERLLLRGQITPMFVLQCGVGPQTGW